MTDGNSPDLKEIFARLSRDGMREADRDYMRWVRVREIALGNPLHVAFPPSREPEEPKPVFLLAVESRPDGAWLVRIDLGRPFKLPPVPGVLLRILAADTGKSDDGLVGWKTFDAIVSAVRASGVTERFTNRALSQAVLRLRRALKRHGYDHRLIQTSRPCRAYRFAFARRPELR